MSRARIDFSDINTFINGLITRDDDCWRQLLLSCGPIVISVCLKSGLNEDDADDIAQTFVMRLLERDCRTLRQLKVDSQEKFFGWAKVVICRLVLDHTRHLKTLKEHETISEQNRRDIENIKPSIDETVDETLIISEIRNKLTPDELTLLKLKTSGLRISEMARILGTNIQACQKRLGRLNEKLADIHHRLMVVKIT